jgi:formate dehydrogenase iron-sulfur subunit
MKSRQLSRRSFLKGVGIGGVAAVLPSRAMAFGFVDESRELTTLLDLSACIGCGACVEACRETNSHKFPRPEKPFPKMHPSRVKAEDWSNKQDVSDRLTPYNWLFIQTVETRFNGREYIIHIPRRCLHCQNPPCANLCPWGAASKAENGIVRIDPGSCLGGAKCRDVCPWSIPQRQTGVGLYLRLLPGLAGNGVMYKCDRCQDRIAKGLLPACIEACPMQIQSIGPRKEMAEKGLDLASSMNGFVYGLEENGGTNTIYVSPVPFEILNKAVETGPGRPHLAKVEESMAKEEVLGMALLTAPLAGLVSGLVAAARMTNARPARDRNDVDGKGSDREEGGRGRRG